MRRLICALIVALSYSATGGDARGAESAQSAPLQLEATIPLGRVRGRIDHLAIDLGRRRLFVAELGNDTVGVIDLREGRVVRTLGGVHEPQGVGYDPSSDSLYVADAADGSVRIFRGPDLMAAGVIALGEDADNVRVDAARHRVIVGYGSGALAVIDADRMLKLADVRLGAHPESFQLDESTGRIFVNIPDAGAIAVIDRERRREGQRWPTGRLRGNFPLALDDGRDRVLAVFRAPPTLAVFRKGDGRLVGAVKTCGDSDDVFLDARRERAYVICGEGAIEVFDVTATPFRSLGRIQTFAGARTGLYVPALDRLFVAVRASRAEPASVRIYRPGS